MKRFRFQNPTNPSWEDDSETVIFGDDLVEDVRPPLENEDDDYDTVPLGQGPFQADAPYLSESSWEEDSNDEQGVDEYLSEDVLEEAEPSAPSFSRPTFEGPLSAEAAFAKPAASIPTSLAGSVEANPLRRFSVPPPALPPLPSRYAVPPQRAEMPTPVMEIFPALDAFRPESRPPPPPDGHTAQQAVRIPPPSPVPRVIDGRYADQFPGASHAAQSHLTPRHLAPPQQAQSFWPPSSKIPFPSRPKSRREDSHLDTLRPYAASTTSSSVSEGSNSAWIATARPWVVAAGERLQDFVDSSQEALRDLLAWVMEAWNSRWQPAASQLTDAHQKPQRAPQPQRAPERGSFAARYLNARSATWALGLAFVALFFVAVRSPGTSSLKAAPPAPMLLDADAILPAENSSGSGEDTESIEEGESAKNDDQEPNEDASLIERARAGENAAVRELNEREPTSLSLEEVQALAVGEERIAQEKASQAVLKIAKKRRLTSADRDAFLRHVENPRTYREALLAMAENRSWQGPDLIYLAMRRYRSQQHVVDFAHSLLLTPRIYKYASPALTVVIDAESMSAEPTSSSECFYVRQLVDRAYEDGDNRAVLHMARFASTTGCGENDAEDCYPCLRDDTALDEALRAAKERRSPF